MSRTAARIELRTGADARRAVHVRLVDRAARIRLEHEALDRPLVPEGRAERRQAAGIGRRAREALVEAVGALEDRPRAGEAGLGEQRRHDAGVGRPARVEALGPRAVRQVLDDAARLAAAESEGRDQFGPRQPEEPPGRRGRAEGAAERSRMEAAPVERTRRDAAHRRHHLDAGDDRGQHLRAGGVTRLARGERRGHAAGAGVHDGVLERVVVVEPVGQRAVRQHGGRHAHLLAAPPETRLGRSAEGPRHGLDAQREVLARGGQRHAGRVEEQAQGLRAHAPRHSRGREVGGEGRQRLGKGVHRASRAVRTSPYHGLRGAVKDGARVTRRRVVRPRPRRRPRSTTREAR